jgi:hypothetical protein
VDDIAAWTIQNKTRDPDLAGTQIEKHNQDVDKNLSISVASDFAKCALKDLLQTMKTSVTTKTAQDNDVKVVIYVDEAHSLTDVKAPPNVDDKSLYDVLCSALSFFVESPLFVIFLSTNSNLSKLSPAPAWARSARARQVDAMQSPITETPFDCAPRLLIKPHTLKLENLNSVEFLSQFGRPL